MPSARRFHCPKNETKLIECALRLVAIVLVLISSCTRIASISTSTHQQQYGSASALPNLAGIDPDPFILLSPLIIGVACRDGVLLIALHSVFSTENGSRNESTLLWKSYEDKNNNTSKDNDSSNLISPQPTQDGFNETVSKVSAVASQKDLPRCYRGPFRIYPLDSSGTTAMVCCGWRTDCQSLANYIRSIDRKERLVFGGKNRATGSINSELGYGSYLACQASLILSKISISEARRPLSCLGLLASGTGLWMVDSTGTYQIRAHAVGAGADQMNEQLKKKDWRKLSSEETAICLLQILFDENDPEAENNSNNNNTNVDKSNSANDVKTTKESLVEIAVTRTVAMPEQTNKVERKMKRLFASELFGKAII